MNLIGTVNVGYEIIEQGNEAVVGYHEGKDEYVAWNYSIRKGEADYCWGRYGGKEIVYEAFRKKELGEYSGS